MDAPNYRPIDLTSIYLYIRRARLHQPHDFEQVEKGDPGVSLGTYATVLFALGLAERLADVADPRHDAVGLELEEERLPKRIRLSRKSAGTE